MGFCGVPSDAGSSSEESQPPGPGSSEDSLEGPSYVPTILWGAPPSLDTAPVFQKIFRKPLSQGVAPPSWGQAASRLPLGNQPTFQGKEVFLLKAIYCLSNL